MSLLMAVLLVLLIAAVIFGFIGPHLILIAALILLIALAVVFFAGRRGRV